jgi:hypothetical protein
MKYRLLTALALALLACTIVAATAFGGGKGRLFQFRGELAGASSTSVQLKVEGGNRAALKALIGQAQTQSFALGAQSEILVWSAGKPKVSTVTDLKAGDTIVVNVRAKSGSSLAEITATPAAVVSDRGADPGKAHRALFLYAGTVAGAQSRGHIALHVTSGNWRGLKSLLGQPVDQSFSYGDGTVFLLWQGKVPTVIDAASLKAGDRITVRVRAARNATLAQVEATPATHVGDHEPGEVETKTS